jgi:cytochrome P450
MTSLLAVQAHPIYWDDPLTWRPSRWISSPISEFNRPQINVATLLRQEEIITPAQGTYFPWSDGPQNCPGAKFAQVEFVAVLACLLRNHRLRILLETAESFEDGRKRVLAVTEDCDRQLLLRMRNAEKVRLTCEPA